MEVAATDSDGSVQLLIQTFSNTLPILFRLNLIPLWQWMWCQNDSLMHISILTSFLQRAVHIYASIPPNIKYTDMSRSLSEWDKV